MIKPNCPRCEIALERRLNAGIFQYACTSCFGFSIHFQNLTKVISAQDFEILLDRGSGPASTNCPQCRNTMESVSHFSGEKEIELDICRRCRLSWLDTGEWHDLKKLSNKVDPHWVDAKKEYAKAVVQLQNKSAKSEQSANIRREIGDLQVSQVLTTLLGLPTEEKQHLLRAKPWLTWLLIFSCSVVTIETLATHPNLIQDWGFHGERSLFLFLSSTITSFFIHASPMHLIGNMYFLWVFGDNVEDHIGKIKFVLLLFLATLAGHIVQLAFMKDAPRVTVVGASGGIFGIVAFYLVTFPQRKFIALIYRRLYAIPGWIFAILFLIIRELEAMSRRSNIAHGAHIGGAAIGIVAAIIMRKQEPHSLSKRNTLHK